MTVPSVCPRCSGPLRPPGLMSSDWECAAHGAVQPYAVAPRASAEGLQQLAARAKVPVWSPLPLLPGWTLAGLAWAGDDRSGARASAVALGGPSPVGGPADLVLVAEEPGTGLGARLAGTVGVDAGELVHGAPDAKVLAAGHPTPLWAVPSAQDRVAFVGEALGVWLWAVLWPPAAELVLLEHVELHDVRHDAHAALDLPVGAPTTRLT
jgi:hypothetical protein